MDNIINYINITECGGTLSVDFIFAILIILIIAQGVLCLISDRLDMVKDAEELGSARMIAESVAETIDATYSGGEGHSTILTLPPAVKDEYRITVNSSTVYVNVGGMMGKTHVMPGSISGAKSNSEVTMYPNRSYNISTMKGGNGYKIVIKEIGRQ